MSTAVAAAAEDKRTCEIYKSAKKQCGHWFVVGWCYDPRSIYTDYTRMLWVCKECGEDMLVFQGPKGDDRYFRDGRAGHTVWAGSIPFQ